MNTIRMTLVSASAAVTLILGACGDTYESEPAAYDEDSAMDTPAYDDTDPAAGDSTGTPDGTATPPAGDDGNGDPAPDGDRCGAGKVAKYVGDEATPDVRARITADVGHTRIRWVGPDTVVTMDYSPERLNVTLDANDVITGANCA